MKYYNIDENIACTAHKLMTYADWEAAGSFEKAANPGDYVEECIIDQMRDCLPPACMNSGFLQMGGRTATNSTRTLANGNPHS